MKKTSETKRERITFSYLWYYLTVSGMFGPYNVSQRMKLFLNGRIKKVTNVFNEEEKNKSKINKCAVDVSPLSCFS